MELLIPLIAAHLAGDFVLQSSSWVKQKEEKGILSWQFWAHGFVHFALAAIFVFKLSFVPWAALLGLLHLCIDLLKRSMTANRRFWFVFDQFLHLASLVLLVAVVQYTQHGHIVIPNFGLSPMQFWAVTAGYIMVTTPASYLIRAFISNWKRDEEGTESFESVLLKPSPEENMATWRKKNKDGQPEELGLENAGFWIGILERVLSYTFIISGQFGAVAFLIGAKSVFRFGDMKEDRQIGFTEYVLIGTLLSFGIAIFTGLLVCKVLALKTGTGYRMF